MDANARLEARLRRLLDLAEEQGVQVTRVRRQVLDQRSATGEHMGVIAVANAPVLPTKLSEVLRECETRGVDPFLILLPDIRHRQNLGAIIRTANAAGVHAIVLSRGWQSVTTPEVARVSMGAVFFTPVIRESIYSVLKTLKSQGIAVIGADMRGEVTYDQADLRGAVALCIGSEGRGLSEELRKRCDVVVNLPMVGVVGSLNVSVACGVLVYEKVRQERAASRQR